MRLIQLLDDGGNTRVGVVDEAGARVRLLDGVDSTYALAGAALAAARSLDEQVAATPGQETLDYPALLQAGRVLPPLHHPDPAHCLVTGTGLTHLGSAAARDAMHQKLQQQAEDGTLTDSMRMFQWGVEGGIPAPGNVGAQPEWFYKGDGGFLVAPEQPLVQPAFADDGGEEPEVVGVYVIGPDGTPWRVGFALANEFSDHVMERQNYLWLAHSKLRTLSFGPELLLGPLPDTVEGMSRIRRNGEVIWEKPFLSGEANMSHTIANLEMHHFKYPGFRRPGDVHVHSFGTATLSFADGIRAQEGDVFEVESAVFGRPLRNPLTIARAETVTVRPL